MVIEKKKQSNSPDCTVLHALKAEFTVKKQENLFSISNNPEFGRVACVCTYIVYIYIYNFEVINCTYRFVHFFHPNLNRLGRPKFKAMLYQLHFKSTQMFCFKYPATIHLTCITHKNGLFLIPTQQVICLITFCSSASPNHHNFLLHIENI